MNRTPNKSTSCLNATEEVNSIFRIISAHKPRNYEDVIAISDRFNLGIKSKIDAIIAFHQKWNISIPHSSKLN